MAGNAITFSLDITRWQQAVNFVFQESQQALPEIINRSALVTIIGGRGVLGAMKRTPKALRATIKAVPIKLIARVVMAKARANGEKLTKAQIRDRIAKEYRRRIAAIGYTANVGWNNAAMAFGGRGIGARASGRSYAQYGYGRESKPGDYTAEMVNTAPAAELIGRTALQQALDDATDDMIAYWEERSGRIFRSVSAT